MSKKYYTSIKFNKDCMDIEGGYTGNNGRVILYPCQNTVNQKFRYKPKTKQIISKSSKKCIDILSKRLIQNKCYTNKKSQKWKKRNKKWVSTTNNKTIKLRIPLKKEIDPKTKGDLVI